MVYGNNNWATSIYGVTPDFEAAAAQGDKQAQVVYGNNNWATSIYGVAPDYLTIRDLSLADGAEFTQQDIDSANKVAVLGRTPVDNLFGDADPIGQTVRIKNVPFTVVGVLTAKGQSSQGQDQDDVILLRISSAKRKVIDSKQANAGGNRLWLLPCKKGCLSGPDRGLALGIARFFARRGAEKGCVSGSHGSGAF